MTAGTLARSALAFSFADEHWQCPRCRFPMYRLSSEQYASCLQCHFRLSLTEGIWRALPAEREIHFRQFISEYTHVRSLEGRGSALSEYYLQLPFKDFTGRNSWQWRIRATSFRYLEQQILPAIQRYGPKSLEILDLGAGNCWLSYRLSLLGHKCTAVDLLDNSYDGLGAAWHYAQALGQPISRVQAEMDSLPWLSAKFDLAIFNASIHYSENYPTTMREVLRCLRPGGYIVIMDSPYYGDELNGLQMVRERRAQFTKRYGFPSDSINSQEFLTPSLMNEMAEQFHLKWQVLKPFYGWKWALRPVTAKLLGRREPSKFHIFWTQVPE